MNIAKRIKIFFILIILFSIIVYVVDVYWDKKEYEAKERFIDLNFQGRVDTLMSMSRGVKILFVDSSSIVLGDNGIPLRGQLNKGDSIIKHQGISGYTIITKEDIGFFIQVYD